MFFLFVLLAFLTLCVLDNDRLLWSILLYRYRVQESHQVHRPVSPELLMYWTVWRCPAENLQLSAEHPNRAKLQSWSPWHPKPSPRYGVLAKHACSPATQGHKPCLTPYYSLTICLKSRIVWHWEFCNNDPEMSKMIILSCLNQTSFLLVLFCRPRPLCCRWARLKSAVRNSRANQEQSLWNRLLLRHLQYLQRIQKTESKR